MILSVLWYMFNGLEYTAILSHFLTFITGSSSRLLRNRFSADLALYRFTVCHFRCKEFNPLVIWIWNQNIAISTIVGTSSHIKTQNDNKIKVSCSANQQNVTLHVKHDHQYRRNFKSLNRIWCIGCFFCIYWDAWFLFSRNASSVLHVECKALWGCLRFTPSLHHV